MGFEPKCRGVCAGASLLGPGQVPDTSLPGARHLVTDAWPCWGLMPAISGLDVTDPLSGRGARHLVTRKFVPDLRSSSPEVPPEPFAG